MSIEETPEVLVRLRPRRRRWQGVEHALQTGTASVRRCRPSPGAPTPAPELNETVGVPLRCTIGENGAPNSAAAAVEGVAPAAAAVVEDGDRGRVGGFDARGASTVLAEEASA